MPSTILKTENEVRDLIRGCTFLGTGGGGSPEKGLEFLLKDLKKGKKIRLISPDQMPNDAWTCSSFYMGSIAPQTPETADEMKKFGMVKPQVEKEAIAATNELMKLQGVKLRAIVPVELGGINTPAPIDVAVSLGIPAVDGDYAGRAIPEIDQTTPAILGKLLEPIVYCDKYGNVTSVKKSINYLMSERLGKMVSVACFGILGGAGFLLKGKDMKKAIIPNTLTEAMKLGKTIRQAREKGKEVPEEIAKVMKGWVLFKGKVIKKDWADKEGYLVGTNTIEGSNQFKGHEFKIWYKNENHISWFDTEKFVTSPDIIECINLGTGEPITNTAIKEGDSIAVIGLKARKKYRSKNGLEVLGPRHFGFDIEYVPIEERIEMLKNKI